jgi:beta-N-acetylhexosaminidase
MIAKTIGSLPLDEKIGHLFFIGIPGPEIDEQTKSLLETVKPGGVCLFARNIREPLQTRQLLDDIRNLSAIEPFLSLDQEGGLVDRLRRVLTPMPAASKITAKQDAQQLAEIIAEATRILGFNMDFAPVVDVIDEKRSAFSNGLYSRAFGSNSAEVVELTEAFIETLEKGGVAGCLKHFPGLGAAEVDSHEELPNVNITRDELESVDLLAYRTLATSGTSRSVMVAHAAYPKIDLQEVDQNGKLLPSSLSFNFVTKLLRQDLRFDGVAITDDLEMGAIIKNYGIGAACKMAINAGEDMLAICANPVLILEGHAAVIAAVESGEISEERIDESINRIGLLKSSLRPPLPFDAARLEALSSDVVELNARLN